MAAKIWLCYVSHVMVKKGKKKTALHLNRVSQPVACPQTQVLVCLCFTIKLIGRSLHERAIASLEFYRHSYTLNIDKDQFFDCICCLSISAHIFFVIVVLLMQVH